MLYEARFVKFQQNMSLKHTIQICNNLNSIDIKPIFFTVKQRIKCNLSDIENLFISGKLPQFIDGSISKSCNGVWQCIVLQSDSMCLVVYTAGHQSPLYMSIVTTLTSLPSVNSSFND